MNSKAIRKQLLAAVAMVLVAAVALGSSTYAWFAANRTVSATGMQATATTSSSLVISDKPNVGTETIQPFTSNTTKLAPSSHNFSRFTNPTGSNTSNLVYNTNPEKVSAQRGYAISSSSALTFGFATNGTTTGSTQYYIDYPVYIASAGSSLAGQDLYVKITNQADTTLKTLNATSIDFYAEQLTDSTKTSVDLAKYVGTLNIAGLDAETNDTTTTKTSLKLCTNWDIPVNGQATQSGDWIMITMRVYIDGDLMQAKQLDTLVPATGTYQSNTTYYTDVTGQTAVETKDFTEATSVVGYYVKEKQNQAFVYSDAVQVGSMTVNVEFTAVNTGEANPYAPVVP